MEQLTTQHLTDLWNHHEPPCVSLYMPTHRYSPDNKQDPILYRNLLRDMELSLAQKYSRREYRPLLEKFQSYDRDTDFWNYRTDGLVMLGSSDLFQVFELQRPVKELLVVADTFHVKPLLRIVQSADRFQILVLSRHRASLYEGNRDVIDPVALPNVPATITEALGEELTEPHLTVASYGDGSGGPHSAHGEPSMYHGHGGRKDEVDIDAQRFFRVVDRAVLEHHSHPSGLPLLLAALPEHHALFRKVSHNPHLMDEGIRSNAEAMDRDELRAEAWRVIEPTYLKRLADLVDGYHVARARGMGTDDVREVSRAAVVGRVGTLLIEADRILPGRVDPEGHIEEKALADPEVGDVIDVLAESVLRSSGEVVVVPAHRFPSTTGVVATYRY